MSRLAELEKWPDHEEWIWPCDCHSHRHALRSTWDGVETDCRYLSIELGYLPLPWRRRLAAVIEVLRGSHTWCDGGALNALAIADLQRFVRRHGAA